MPEQTAGTFTQSPAATAFSALYGRALNYVGAPTDTDATTIAKEGIVAGIKRINTRTWSWSLAAATVTFVSGESGREYLVATNFKSPRSFELLDASSRIAGRLYWEDPKTFDRDFENRASANDPTHYTVFNPFDNGYLTINAAPTAAWVVSYPTGRLRYYKRVAFLSADAEVLAAPTEVEEFLVWHARMVLAAHFDFDKLPFAERQAERFWRDLIRDDVTHSLRDWTE